jgi:hypothetical protein
LQDAAFFLLNFSFKNKLIYNNILPAYSLNAGNSSC